MWRFFKRKCDDDALKAAREARKASKVLQTQIKDAAGRRDDGLTQAFLALLPKHERPHQ